MLTHLARLSTTCAVPFPRSFKFLNYVPPIKRWGPYRVDMKGRL